MSNEQGSRTVAIFSRSIFERFIPEKALQIFPLKAEPINSWNNRGLDLKKFLKYICDKEAQVTYADGIPRKTNYKSYWKTLFAIGLARFRSTAKEFAKEAKSNPPAPASIIQAVKIPSFINDKYYGLMAKHYVCYDGVINTALSESYFFSIAHMMETQQELDCSILLAQSLYYKQSLQVLRNFVELMATQILFCHDSNAFDDWRNGKFRLPRFRGKDGLLERLTKEGLISPDLKKSTSDIYSKLNSYIHSMEKNLIHRGIYKGSYRGFIFDYDYFKIWCNSFSEVVENGILLLDAHFEQVANMKKSGIVCDICHNETKFDSEEDEFAGIKYLRLTCKVCKNLMIIRV
jgi:hypothetical protein